jgi:hypothetical protein
MRLKKQFSFLLAFFLLISHSGMAFNVHYCGDKIAAISSVFSKEEVCDVPVKEVEECCKKQTQSHKKCCSDKEINLENDTDTVLIKSFSGDNTSFFTINEWKFLFFNNAEFLSYSQNCDYYFYANAPPLYQLYSQYLFYD